MSPDHSYLIVGGLRGLCGSLATWLAKNGAKHLAIMSRSGSADEKSLGVIKDVEAQGCAVELLQGDVADEDDVRRCLGSTSVPIGGIVQGAMVLRVSWRILNVLKCVTNVGTRIACLTQ